MVGVLKMIKVKKQKPRRIDDKYFLLLPKNVVESLGIDETIDVEAVINVVQGKVWSRCNGTWER